MRFPSVDLPAATRRYTLLGQLVTLSASDAPAPWLDRLDGLLAAFPATSDDGAGAIRFDVRPGQDAALWQIEHDGCVIPAYSDNALLREVERRAFAAAARQSAAPLLLHAGAVARDGVALLLPAASGSGKSTLTLALARRGWLPLTDDICPLVRAGEDACGEWIALTCPRCCHLSVEAVEALCVSGIAFDGPVASLAGYYQPAAWGTSAPVRAIAVPHFTPNAAPRAIRLTQAECLAALISSTFDHASQPGSARRAAALDLAVQAPGFRLTYATVDEALRLVDTVVDGLMRGTPAATVRQVVLPASYPA